MLWGFWAGRHWRGPDAALVDLDWRVNAAGRRFEEVMAAWRTDVTGTTDADGRFPWRGFHGTYEVTVAAPGRAAAVETVALDPGADALGVEVRLAP